METINMNIDDEIKVSICCITYNHKKYIEKALKSFLKQKTNFRIEILVKDDNSTDGTTEVIKNYERKYPNIIKGLYFEENQYSKGLKAHYRATMKLKQMAKGKYIAFCEGDDFWNDEYKLQKQYDFLEKYPEYIMCFHAVEKITVSEIPTGDFLGPYKKGNKEYKMNELLLPGFVHLSSIFVKSQYIKCDMPDFYKKCHLDFALTAYIAGKGRVYYIDEIMSCYRVGVENSIMTKERLSYSKTNHISKLKKRNTILKEADAYFKYNYTKEINEVIDMTELHICILENDFSKLFKRKYMNIISKNGVIWLLKEIVFFKFIIKK